MEPVSHTLAGVALAQAGISGRMERAYGPKARKWSLRVLLLGSLFPDVDQLVILFGGMHAYVQYHRGITHSFLGAVLFSIGLGLLLRWLWRVPLVPAVFLCGLGMAGHITLDWITPYGTLVLLPLSNERLAADWLFIVDFLFASAIALPLLLGWRLRSRRRLLAGVGLAAAGCYVAFCASQHSLAVGRVDEAARAHGWDVVETEAFPLPFLPVRWMGVVETEEGFYQSFFWTTDSGPPEFTYFAKLPENPFVSRSEELELVQVYRWFARFPVGEYRETEGGHRVRYFDLRYSILPRGRPFLIEIVFDGEGRVRRAYYRRRFFHSPIED